MDNQGKEENLKILYPDHLFWSKFKQVPFHCDTMVVWTGGTGGNWLVDQLSTHPKRTPKVPLGPNEYKGSGVFFANDFHIDMQIRHGRIPTMDSCLDLFMNSSPPAHSQICKSHVYPYLSHQAYDMSVGRMLSVTVDKSEIGWWCNMLMNMKNWLAPNVWHFPNKITQVFAKFHTHSKGIESRDIVKTFDSKLMDFMNMWQSIEYSGHAITGMTGINSVLYWDVFFQMYSDGSRFTEHNGKECIAKVVDRRIGESPIDIDYYDFTRRPYWVMSEQYFKQHTNLTIVSYDDLFFKGIIPEGYDIDRSELKTYTYRNFDLLQSLLYPSKDNVKKDWLKAKKDYFQTFFA